MKDDAALQALGQALAKERAWPKVGSIHPCAACGKPNIGRFLGVKNGKGQWRRLERHGYYECQEYSKTHLGY